MAADYTIGSTPQIDSTYLPTVEGVYTPVAARNLAIALDNPVQLLEHPYGGFGGGGGTGARPTTGFLYPRRNA